jgi:hypothetical protein
MQPMTEAQLLAKIERYVKRHGITLTEFGIRAANNSALVTRLKAGKTLTMATMNKAMRYMENGRI